jgi:hypothetical protein
MAAKLSRLTHKIAIQLNLVADSCTIWGSRSRRPVRKLLVTASYVCTFLIVITVLYYPIMPKRQKSGLWSSYLTSHIWCFFLSLSRVHPHSVYFVYLLIILLKKYLCIEWRPIGPQQGIPTPYDYRVITIDLIMKAQFDSSRESRDRRSVEIRTWRILAPQHKMQHYVSTESGSSYYKPGMLLWQLFTICWNEYCTRHKAVHVSFV